MKTASKKLSSLALAVILAVGTLPQAVLALPKTDIGGEIIAFEDLQHSVKNQEVTLGTVLQNLELPDALTATVEITAPEEPADTVQDSGKPGQKEEATGNDSKQQTVDVPVLEWTSEPGYDPEAMGTYVFTPVLDAAWRLADDVEDVELPTITVQVIMGIMPLASTASVIDLGDSDAALSAGATASGGRYNYNTITKEITINSGSMAITGTTTDRQVQIADGVTVDVTLNGMSIDVSAIGDACAFELTGSSVVNLTLSGTNTLKSGSHKAGLQVNSNSTLTISGAAAASLNAYGGNEGAGIGGGTDAYLYNGGTIKITGGTITANSGSSGAGIGGGMWGSGGTIEISGGTVIANGVWGAGIGGGGWNNGGNITISGGTVTANSIGYGYQSSGGTLTITGGSVNSGDVNIQPTNGQSANVFLNTLTVGNPSIGDNVPVDAIGYDGTLPYGSDDVVTTNGGKLYAWLPQNSNSSAKVDVIPDVGGAVYTKTWARTGTSESQTLLQVGNAELPSITGQPQDAVYNQGDTTTPLSVTASVSDGGSLSYQWYKNTGNSTTGGTLVGTDSASYAPDTGTVGTLYYYCIVTNTNAGVNGSQTATATSGVAAVTVNALVNAETPNISGQPQNGTYTQGNPATALSVAASVSDGGTLSYQWYKNASNSVAGGTPVGTNSTNYTPVTNTIGTLYYYCVVTNTNTGVSGIQSATATSGVAAVTVNALVNAEMPNISGQPQGATYNQGGTVTPLSVTANVTDSGTLSYQWYQNTTNNNTDGSQITGAITASYTPDTGTVGSLYYYCVVTNTNTGVNGTQTATATSGVAAITVNALVNAETPSITAQPQDATYNQGAAVTPLSVTASVTDGGTLSYQWYSSTTNSNADGTPIADATAATYTPPTDTTGTFYYYTVVTNTNIGVSGVQTATVTSSVAAIIVNSSGGSSDSDSDSAAVTVLPKNQPDYPTIGSVTGKTTVTDTMVKSALDNAQAAATAQNRTAYGIGARIALDAPTTTGLTITMERAALNRLVSTGAKRLELTGIPATITLDAQALLEIQKQGDGNVTFTVKSTAVNGVRNAYDITFTTVKDGKVVTITSFGSGFATLAIPIAPDKNEAVGSFYGVYVDATGKINRIAASAYDTNSGNVIFNTNHFSVYGVGYTAPTATFTDIGTHWAKESIDFVIGRGLLFGTSGTAFAPEKAITRGELATALGRMAGLDITVYPKSSFTDVTADSVSRPYIEWAYSKGIIQGIGSNQFAPDRAITREEIAVILQNYAKATGYKLPLTHVVAVYADASSIGSGYKAVVTAMQQAGVLTGKQNNQFNPTGNTTRAEVSAMLHRYSKLTIDPATAQGWAQNDDGQWLFYKDGTMLTGAQPISGVKYFFDDTGALKTGWVQDTVGNWRYYADNKLLTGWSVIDTNGNQQTYYFDTYGNRMAGKWIQIEGKWYYFKPDGSLAKSTIIDGYEVDEHGVRKG